MCIGRCIIVIIEEYETNLMSQFIKFFFFTSSVLNMFRTLINPSSGACYSFLLYHYIGCVFVFRCVLEFRCGWVGVESMWQASHTETPTHIETRTHNQCSDTIEKSCRLLMMDVLMSETC